MVNIALAGDDANLYEYSSIRNAQELFDHSRVWLLADSGHLHRRRRRRPVGVARQCHVAVHAARHSVCAAHYRHHVAHLWGAAVKRLHSAQHVRLYATVAHAEPAVAALLDSACPTGAVLFSFPPWHDELVRAQVARLRFERKTNFPNQVIDITPWVPLDVQRVILSRYQIVPPCS